MASPCSLMFFRICGRSSVLPSKTPISPFIFHTSTSTVTIAPSKAAPMPITVPKIAQSIASLFAWCYMYSLAARYGNTLIATVGCSVMPCALPIVASVADFRAATHIPIGATLSESADGEVVWAEPTHQPEQCYRASSAALPPPSVRGLFASLKIFSKMT